MEAINEGTHPGDWFSAPDDCFTLFAIPCEQWIHTDDYFLEYVCSNLEEVISGAFVPEAAYYWRSVELKTQLVGEATKAYENFKGCNHDGLRHPPHVTVNYTPVKDLETGILHLWFFFKEGNNGTTVKVHHEIGFREIAYEV